MKIKNGYMLRNIAGENVIVATDSSAVSLNGMITLNSSGLFIYQHLTKDITFEELLSKFLEEYDVDEQTAKKDITAFLVTLEAKGLLEQ